MDSYNATHAFSNLCPTAAQHFKLYYYAAVLRVIEQVMLVSGSSDAAFSRFPFLAGYYDALAEYGLEGCALADAPRAWQAAIERCEANAGASVHLPLCALRRAAALNHDALTTWMIIGLAEEDARFGAVFEALQGTTGARRPTGALIAAWAAGADDNLDGWTVIKQLASHELVRAVDPDMPRAERVLHIPAMVWDAARGDTQETLGAGLRYHPAAGLIPIEALITHETLRAQVDVLLALIRAGDVGLLIVRGPSHNGRRALLGALARAAGRRLLEVQATTHASAVEQTRWRLVGPLATLLDALPAFVFDLAPGDQVELPALPAFNGSVGVILGQHGTVTSAGDVSMLTMTVPAPDAETRRQHWLAGLAGFPAADLERLSQQFRMTSGHLRRLARDAVARATIAGHASVVHEDALDASRAMSRQLLEPLAMPIEPLPMPLGVVSGGSLTNDGAWHSLCVGPETQSELRLLEARCRYRERLDAVVGPALASQSNRGVRALLTGPSGTGKTLAARALASALGMPLYRLDLASVVSKYIGETEKNLSQVFDRAESLDVILLLDEGDALLTNRTSVHTSNDRYANLETNYLLQRLESYDGVLLVTTNAGERIDSAFLRRMDMVIHFRAPDVAERQMIWQLHLPERNAIEPAILRDVTLRCELTGGQIRNAVLHAALLALNDGGVVSSAHLEAAVLREYRKSGAVCPLRRSR